MPLFKKLLTLVICTFGLFSSTSLIAQGTSNGVIETRPNASVLIKTFLLHLNMGKVSAEESLIRVNQGDQVEITVQSDLPGELHLHAYRLKLPIIDNSPQKLSFKANASGKFQFEWHPHKNEGDHSKMIATHHGPSLASLEVMP